MNKIGNRGQSLAIFVIFIPVFIMIGTLVVDVAFAKYNARKLDNITMEVIRYGLKHFDEEPYNNMVDLIYQNDSDIDSYKIDFNEETCFFIDKLTREGNLIELIINEDNNLSKEQLLFLKNILKKHDVYYYKIIRETFLNDKNIDIAINGKDINWEEVYQNIVNIATNYKYSDKNDSKKYIKK